LLGSNSLSILGGDEEKSRRREESNSNSSVRSWSRRLQVGRSVRRSIKVQAKKIQKIQLALTLLVLPLLGENRGLHSPIKSVSRRLQEKNSSTIRFYEYTHHYSIFRWRTPISAPHMDGPANQRPPIDALSGWLKEETSKFPAASSRGSKTFCCMQ